MENIPFRIGHGYDVHRLVEGRKLIMGGVEIPYEKGLLGHSDADVLLHAVSDALLGALALGDIGKHFPDTDPAYAGADSLKLLELVVEKVRHRAMPWAIWMPRSSARNQSLHRISFPCGKRSQQPAVFLWNRLA